MEVQALKSHLKNQKITYEQLSERSGIPLNTLKNIFSGRTPNPRIDTMQAIEAALGLSYEKVKFTNADKDAGVELKHREVLSPDEMEVVDTYRAIKSEKGEKTAHAIKSMMKAFLDEK